MFKVETSAGWEGDGPIFCQLGDFPPQKKKQNKTKQEQKKRCSYNEMTYCAYRLRCFLMNFAITIWVVNWGKILM